MLSLPVYARNGIYYLHTRLGPHQIKRSLNTKDPQIAMIRALELLKVIEMTIDLKKIKKYDLDLANGIFKSNGADDHRNMMEALETIGRLNLLPQQDKQQKVQSTQQSQQPTRHPLAENPEQVKGLKLPEVVDKFFNLKKHLKPATIISYKSTVQEFAVFSKNQYVQDYIVADISSYMDHLAKTCQPRTIDSKIGILNTIFAFAKKHGYYFGENPAAEKRLMSKKERARNGYAIFEAEEIETVFKPEHLKSFKEKDPDFYYCILLALITGARATEICSLEISQLKDNPVPHLKIRDAKTEAGIREIPVIPQIYDELKKYATGKSKIFKYIELEGKGTGNAVGKKFKRHLQKLKITRDKLVFHSLRKFFNDFMKKQKIQIEARCQMIGHELDNVNETVYASSYSTEDLANLVIPVQQKILMMIHFQGE